MKDEPEIVTNVKVNIAYEAWLFVSKLLLLTIGSFIFVLATEDYKGQLASRSIYIDKYYVPAKESVSNCAEVQLQLANDYRFLAGYAQAMPEIMRDILQNPNIRRSREYEMYALNMVNGFIDANKRVGENKTALHKCINETNNTFDLLVAVTGDYDSFSKVKIDYLNLYANISNETKSKAYTELGNDPETLILDVIKQGFEDPKSIQTVIDAYPLLASAYEESSAGHQKIYDNMSTYYSQILGGALKKINDSFKSPFLSWLS